MSIYQNLDETRLHIADLEGDLQIARRLKNGMAPTIERMLADARAYEAELVEAIAGSVDTSKCGGDAAMLRECL